MSKGKRYVIVIPQKDTRAPIKVAEGQYYALKDAGHTVSIIELFERKKSIAFFIKSAVKIYSLLNNSDAVISHGIQPNIITAFFRFFSKRKKTLFVAMLHTNPFLDLIEKGALVNYLSTKIWAYCLRCHDYILHLNTSTIKELDCEHKAIKVNNGLPITSNLACQEDLSFYNFLSVNRDRTLVGTWCVLRSVKNIIKILDFIEKNNNFAAVIIGDGPEFLMLIDSAKKRNLYDRTFFTGFKVNPYCYAKHLDCALFPSISEGFPIAVLEAFSWGIPAVSSNIPAFIENFNELVKHVDFNDLNSVLDAINYSIAHRKIITEKNQQALVDKFNYDRIVEHINQKLFDTTLKIDQ